MITANGNEIRIEHFPDGTQRLKYDVSGTEHKLVWLYENEEELSTLIYVTKHIRNSSQPEDKQITLLLPYLPNARMDRTKKEDEVFTLKYFCDIINWLQFDSVKILDVHSNVGAALLNRAQVMSPAPYIAEAIRQVETDEAELILFFPDEGASKRYADMFPAYRYIYGNKKREWGTGKILGTEIMNPYGIDLVGKRILMVDDICSRGTTFVKSAEALKPHDVKDIYLYVTHCENTILEGEVLTSGSIERVFTTNSIFTKEHEKITAMEV